MTTTVALTGATGFTGSALMRRLVADGYAVRVLVRDASRLEAVAGVDVVVGEFTDAAAIARFCDGADTIMHIAAMYRAEGTTEEFVAANTESTKALLRAGREAGVRRFVYCSTIGVHGSVPTTPGDETSPISPRDPYQESKLLAEEACRAAMAEGDLEIVIVRPCGIYGPGDTRMLKIFTMVQKGVFFFVGQGRANFHPVYIDDLVDGLMLAMTVPAAAGETFIIGGPRYMPLRDYVDAAARSIGAKPPWITIPYGLMNLAAGACEAICKPLGVQPPLHRRRLTFFKHNRAFSTDKARRILGYRPRIELDEGFRRTVAWYREKGYLR